MLKQLTSKKNLNEAYLRVYRNKGAAGVDAIQVTELKAILKVHGEHYANQIEQLESDEKKLKGKIIKFREDELHHKDIAYKEGATKKGPYSILDKIIKTGSKIAINISEKI